MGILTAVTAVVRVAELVACCRPSPVVVTKVAQAEVLAACCHLSLAQAINTVAPVVDCPTSCRPSQVVGMVLAACSALEKSTSTTPEALKATTAHHHRPRDRQRQVTVAISSPVTSSKATVHHHLQASSREIMMHTPLPISRATKYRNSRPTVDLTASSNLRISNTVKEVTDSKDTTADTSMARVARVVDIRLIDERVC